MFEPHICFNTPSDDIKIWRYMDFTKFMNLLDTQSLFFVRSDKFDDPFEGLYPRANKGWWTVGNEGEYDYRKHMELINAWHRKHTTINCWHMNNYESAAMWDLYLKNGDGIAIQSTVLNFKNSLNVTDKVVYLGEVNYIDYYDQLIPSENIYAPYTYKRKSFEHEREIRAVYTVPNKYEEPGVINVHEDSPVQFGTPIECSIETLIENIYVSPNSPKWFEELVRSVCKKYGLEKEIIKSKLYEVTY
ncbi:hypothetical protein ACQKD9_15530 [Bacillus paramycoides]|uniref:hypothetical protein n=1 Tax=Bacillus paramycoides TaxID=2026194 RepID=UPI003D04AB5F